MKKLIIQRATLSCSDILSLMTAFFLSILITQKYHNGLASYAWENFFHLGPSKLLALLIIAIFASYEQYSRRRPFWEELLQTYRVIILFMIINLGLAFILNKGSYKVMIVSFWGLFALSLPLYRNLTKLILKRGGLWLRDLYIIGDQENAIQAYHLLAKNSLMGYNLCGFVHLDKKQIKHILPAPSLEKEAFLNLLGSNPHCEIVVALNNKELNQQIRLINVLQHKCLYLSILPEIAGLALYGAEIEHFFGNDHVILKLNNNLSRKLNVIAKRVFDFILVGVGLLLLTPLFIIIASLIYFSGNRKVFYFHKRIGKAGKPFYCIKFQTMYANSAELLANLLAKDANAKAEWEQDFKLKNDPRVTPIGRWLRKTSLDELPQLINVLKGDMSLVGPRPIIEAEIERYEEGYYYYQLALPGITGLWQVSGRNDTGYANRIRFDEWYVKNWSLWYDIVILLKTIKVVFQREGAY